MSELMDQAVIGMPYEMAMEGEVARRQFYSRAQSLLAEVQLLRDQVAALQSAESSYQSGYDAGRRMGAKHRQSEVEQLKRDLDSLLKDKDRLDAIEGNCWDVRYESSPNADAGDSSISIEIIGHYQGAPHVRVLGENYTENLRAAIDQAMTAEAYPPERPEYDDHGRPLRTAKA